MSFKTGFYQFVDVPICQSEDCVDSVVDPSRDWALNISSINLLMNLWSESYYMPNSSDRFLKSIHFLLDSGAEVIINPSPSASSFDDHRWVEFFKLLADRLNNEKYLHSANKAGDIGSTRVYTEILGRLQTEIDIHRRKLNIEEGIVDLALRL